MSRRPSTSGSARRPPGVPRITTGPLPAYETAGELPNITRQSLPSGRVPSTYPPTFAGSITEVDPLSEAAAPWTLFKPDAVAKLKDAAGALPPHVSLRRLPSQAVVAAAKAAAETRALNDRHNALMSAGAARAAAASGGAAAGGHNKPKTAAEEVAARRRRNRARGQQNSESRERWRPFPVEEEGNRFRRPYTAPDAHFTNRRGDLEGYVPENARAEPNYRQSFKKTGSHVAAREVQQVQSHMAREGAIRKLDEDAIAHDEFLRSMDQARVFGTSGPPTMSGPTHRFAQLPPPKGGYSAAQGDHNDETFRRGVVQSFRNDRVELQFQGLTRVSRLLTSTLCLQLNHILELRLLGNEIKELPDWAVAPLNRLETLAIGHNQLTRLPHNLGCLTNLTSLHAERNRIAFIPASCTSLVKLRSLNLQGNMLERLPHDLGVLQTLRDVQLDDNPLKEIPSSTAKLVFLRTLNLSRNQFASLAFMPRGPRPADELNKTWHAWEKVALGDRAGGHDLPFVWYNRLLDKAQYREPVREKDESDFVDTFDEAYTVLVRGWRKLVDQESGYPYYEHRETGESTWEQPVDEQATQHRRKAALNRLGRGTWSFHVDESGGENAGKVYYLDNVTGEKKWRMPRNLDQLGCLVQLTRLEVSNNILKHLPETIGRLRSLEYFNCDSNEIDLLPEGLCDLKNLHTLSCGSNKLTMLPRGLGHCTALAKLVISRNQIAHLPASLSRATKLRIIMAQNNRISVIPATYHTLANLDEFLLSNNPDLAIPEEKIVALGVRHILHDCKERFLRGERGTPPRVDVTRIGINESIYVPVPRYSDEMNATIAKAAVENTLSLHWQNLTEVPASILVLENLVELRLTNNMLKTIPPEIRELRALEVLWLSNNHLKDVPEALGGLRQLKQLSLEDNFIEVVPEKTVRMKSLEVLLLSNNRLEALPQTFGKLRSLRELAVDVNRLKALPSSICDLKHLEALHLSKNEIAELPLSFGKLTTLRTLYINQNKLTDLPINFGQLESLESLRIAHNHLSNLDEGIFLDGLQHSLRRIWLSGNRLEQLPPTFGSLKVLEEVRLDMNPMRSPPPEVYVNGVEPIREYCRERQLRFKEIARLFSNPVKPPKGSGIPRGLGMALDPKRLGPRTNAALGGNRGYLRAEDLDNVDAEIDKYLNGDIYSCEKNGVQICDWVKELMDLREQQHYAQVLTSFIEFIETANLKGRLNAGFYNPNLERFWGEPVLKGKGKQKLSIPTKVACYGFVPGYAFRPQAETGRSMLDEVAGEAKQQQGVTIDVNFDIADLKRAVRKFRGPYGPVAKLEDDVEFAECKCSEICYIPEDGETTDSDHTTTEEEELAAEKAAGEKADREAAGIVTETEDDEQKEKGGGRGGADGSDSPSDSDAGAGAGTAAGEETKGGKAGSGETKRGASSGGGGRNKSRAGGSGAAAKDKAGESKKDGGGGGGGGGGDGDAKKKPSAKNKKKRSLAPSALAAPLTEPDTPKVDGSAKVGALAAKMKSRTSFLGQRLRASVSAARKGGGGDDDEGETDGEGGDADDEADGGDGDDGGDGGGGKSRKGSKMSGPSGGGGGEGKGKSSQSSRKESQASTVSASSRKSSSAATDSTTDPARMSKRERKLYEKEKEKEREEAQKAAEEAFAAKVARQAAREEKRRLKKEMKEKKAAIMAGQMDALNASTAEGGEAMLADADLTPEQIQMRELHRLFCGQAHKDGQLPCKRRGLVLQKLIVTDEEAARKQQEEHLVEMARLAWSERLDLWFTTNEARKKLKGELRKRKGKHKAIIRRARSEHKDAVLKKDQAVREGKAVAKRKVVLDKGGEDKEFSSAKDAEVAVAEHQRKVDEQEKLVQKLDGIRGKIENNIKGPRLEQETALREEMLKKYVNLEKNKIVRKNRFEALELNLRRPWDGPNGKEFLKWRQKLDQQWSDSDSEGSSSEESVDINDEDHEYFWDSDDEETMWQKMLEKDENEIAREMAAEAKAQGGKVGKITTLTAGSNMTMKDAKG